MLLEDDGQPLNAPGGHMQPVNNAENMAVNLSTTASCWIFCGSSWCRFHAWNVDHWLKSSTRLRRSLQSYNLSLEYMILTNEDEPVTLKEVRPCDQNSKWEVALQEETKASLALRSQHPWHWQIKAIISPHCRCLLHFSDLSILDQSRLKIFQRPKLQYIWLENL